MPLSNIVFLTPSSWRGISSQPLITLKDAAANASALVFASTSPSPSTSDLLYLYFYTLKIMTVIVHHILQPQKYCICVYNLNPKSESMLVSLFSLLLWMFYFMLLFSFRRWPLVVCSCFRIEDLVECEGNQSPVGVSIFPLLSLFNE